MDDLLALAEFFDEFLDAELVDENRFLRLPVDAFVGQADLESAVEEGQFPHAGAEALEDEFGRGENLAVRQKRDLRSGLLFVLQLAENFELLGRLALGEGHEVDLAVAVDLGLEPLGERVDAFRADAVETAAEFVSALAEFAAGVEVGQHQLDGRDLPLRVHVDRNAAAVVADGAGAVRMDGHVDVRAKSGQMLVDRVVEDLVNAMVQTALVGVADVHPRPLAHGLQAFQFVDLGRAVFRALGRLRFLVFLRF